MNILKLVINQNNESRAEIEKRRTKEIKWQTQQNK
jgi:hypothetical protein